MEEALQGDVNSLRQSKASLNSGTDRLYNIVASLCGQKYTDFHRAWTDLACKEEKLTADLKEVQRQKETLLRETVHGPSNGNIDSGNNEEDVITDNNATQDPPVDDINRDDAAQDPEPHDNNTSIHDNS